MYHEPVTASQGCSGSASKVPYEILGLCSGPRSVHEVEVGTLFHTRHGLCNLQAKVNNRSRQPARAAVLCLYCECACPCVFESHSHTRLHTVGPPLTSNQVSRNAHDFLRLGPSAGRKEAAAPNFHAKARALMVLERPSAKQPAASRPTAARRPQRPRSCLGSRFEIFSMKPAHLNNGWRTTAADVSAASGAHSTPTPTPSPLTISPLSRQASTLLQPRPIEWAQAPTRSADWRRS